MNLKDARETVESHLRYLCNRPESWGSEPMPANVQEALCLLTLGTKEQLAAEVVDETRKVLAEEFQGDGW